MKSQTPIVESQPLYQAAVVMRLAENKYLTCAAPAKASMLSVTTPPATISHPLKPQIQSAIYHRLLRRLAFLKARRSGDPLRSASIDKFG